MFKSHYRFDIDLYTDKIYQSTAVGRMIRYVFIEIMDVNGCINNGIKINRFVFNFKLNTLLRVVTSSYCNTKSIGRHTRAIANH